MSEVCYGLFCFVPPGPHTAPRIFGFAEFITALALLMVLYTVIDIRYKFRLSITPGRLYLATFVLIAIIGGETLLTEVWLAEGWWLPKSAGLTASIWQAIFGSLFLGAFLTWMYYAFIRPPIFSKRNAKRFAHELYRIILKGNDDELAVIADELARSTTALVKLSRRLVPRYEQSDEIAAAEKTKRNASVEDYAYDILLLIANRKFCRHIVASSPVTALIFFDAMTKENRYNIPIGQFARAISTEALANKDSILYHEDDGFTSGLIGYLKPWTKTIYGNFALIETLAERHGSPLDVDYRARRSWDVQQWKAYSSATLVALESYLNSGNSGMHSYAIYRALDALKDATRDIYKLNGIDEFYSNDIYDRLNVVVRFLRDAVELIEKQKVPPSTVLRRQKKLPREGIYDHLANFMFELIFAASSISGPPDRAWAIHHNMIWSQLFDMTGDGKAWKIIQFKLRRLLYDEVARLTKMPNYKGARILGFLLNVMGTKITSGNQGYGREYRALAKTIHAWTKRSYLKLRGDYPDVADAVLIGSISLDSATCRLVKTFASFLGTEPSREYLELNPLPALSEEPARPA